MTPERWARVKDVLARALEAPPGERDAFLDGLGAGDAELRAEVASLLAAAEGDESLPGARAAIAAAQRSARPETAPELLEGDRTLQTILESALGQQYEILRPLGRGGMGAVYLARERALERFVAIKVLRPELAADADGRERFRREARIAAQLSHPNILPLHTFGEVHGLWYFVMGYVRGVSLAERLRMEERLTSGEAHRILSELADALDCAHRHGVVHRDIKPANVLLDDESGRAVLADFGISKVQGGGDSLTATGAVVGTPHFMSPEQSLGSPAVDERSDIYSLGAVGYTMLAGREPFADARAGELTTRRLSHDPPPLAAAAPSAPGELAATVMRCLARDPALRWPSAQAFRDALARSGGDPSAVVLPESLRDLPTFGPYALLWAAFWSTLAARTLHAPADRALLLLVATVVPVGLMLHLWNEGRDGLATSRLVRVAFWPPEWWSMWWPPSLRRPNDLWPRLPRPARALRAALSALIVGLPALILTRQWLEPAGDATERAAARGWFAAAEAAIVVGAAVAIVAALLWARRRGLTMSSAVRVLFGATLPSSGWSAPDVARLLTHAGSVRAPDRHSPADHRRAIQEVARLLPPAAVDAGARAVRVAQRLLEAIERCDVEIASLSLGASAADVDRLTAQLGALERGPAAASPEGLELRELVGRQLALVRAMHARCELVSRRRAHLLALMRGLWTQVRLAHDEPADPTGGPPGEGQLLALCAQVERELEEPDALSGVREGVARIEDHHPSLSP